MKKSTAAKREQHSQSTASMGARQRNGTVDGEPLVQVLALGQYDGVAQVAASQSGLCILFELHEMKGGGSARTQGRARRRYLVLLGALANVLLRLERLVAVPFERGDVKMGARGKK